MPERSAAVLADRLDGAFLECGQAGGVLLRAAGLSRDIAAPPGVVALEVPGRRLPAEVAVDARGVDVEASRNVLRNLQAEVGHRSTRTGRSRSSGGGSVPRGPSWV